MHANKKKGNLCAVTRTSNKNQALRESKERKGREVNQTSVQFDTLHWGVRKKGNRRFKGTLKKNTNS